MFISRHIPPRRMSGTRRSPRKVQTSLYSAFRIPDPNAPSTSKADSKGSKGQMKTQLVSEGIAMVEHQSNRRASKPPLSTNGKTPADFVADLFPGPSGTGSETKVGQSAVKAAPTVMVTDSLEAEASEGTDEVISDTDEAPMEEEAAPSPDPTAPQPQEPFMGSALADIRKWTDFDISLPPLRGSESHAVLFRVSGSGVDPSTPYPSAFRDIWDSHSVRMPCSSKNTSPSKEKGEPRWTLIQNALLSPIKSSLDFEDIVRQYNPGQRWRFTGIHAFFNEYLSKEESARYLGVLGKVGVLAARLPTLVTQPIPLLRRGRARELSLSQEQAACLLAHALFSAFPRRNSHHPKAEFAAFNAINFARLYGLQDAVTMEKWRCVLHYFERVTTVMPIGVISFKRLVRPAAADWAASTAAFQPLHVSQVGTIEDDGEGLTQLDFANKYLGGGVLGRGAVQEEIRFLICPELLLSCLFTEVLEANEALLMTGCERFSNYSGYANSFRWAGDHQDATQRDAWGRLRVEVLAIDAVCYGAHRVQFMPRMVDRELGKALVGFGDGGAGLATGNWGCGAFGGDLHLKSAIQLMAAAEARRPLAYFTFGDGRLMGAMTELHAALKGGDVRVGGLYRLLLKYYEDEVEELDSGRPKTRLFPYILARIAAKAHT